jgi:hypothetical protein
MLTEEQVQSDVIKVSDRCDACGSQAFVWVNGVNGDLFFCGHHFVKHEDKLREYAFEIIDERNKI